MVLYRYLLRPPVAQDRLRLKAEGPRVIRQILAYLGLSTEVPQPRPQPARAAEIFSDTYA